MRRTILILITALLLVGALASAVVATAGGTAHSDITRARLERSLPVTFSHLYAQQAALLGHHGVSAASLHARAMCDKGGATSADVGPGGDWNCLMSWDDPNTPMPPEGYGKFEMNVHSNGCYTASSPSKLVGFQTITDARGRQVENPVFEFDGCFDPHGDTTPTGVSFPSVVTVTSTTITPTSTGRVGVQLSCGTGSDGCAGTVTATAGGRLLGSVDVRIKEEQTAKVVFPRALPAGAGEVTLTVHGRTGFWPPKPVTLPVG